MAIKQTESEYIHPRSGSSGSIEGLFTTLGRYEPKPVTNFVGEHAIEQKNLFLADEIRNPINDYQKLKAIDFHAMQAGIEATTIELTTQLKDDAIATQVYEQYGKRYAGVTRFMEVAALLNATDDSTEKQSLAEEYMQLNIELYGEPKEAVYRSLVSDSLNTLRTKEFGDRAQLLYDELLGMLPRAVMELDAERFRPSQETVAWAGTLVEALHGGLLSHVPEETPSFTSDEMKEIFETIIATEFVDSDTGENAAEGWEVVVDGRSAVNVKANERKVTIPIDKVYSRDAVRGLIVHELGIHMLRSVAGSQSNIYPLRSGLANYYDSEEGLGVVAEQALRGSYRVAGEGHYVTAGLAYFDKKDFRDTFEIKWRLSLLNKLADGADVTDQAIETARTAAYGSVNRIFRGTDSLPWFKDLAYYNGSESVWRYLEDHRGDDTYISLLFLGKAEPLNHEHRRILLESSTN